MTITYCRTAPAETSPTVYEKEKTAAMESGGMSPELEPTQGTISNVHSS